MGSSRLLPGPGQPTKGPDPSFKGAAVPNIVTFSLAGVSPPSPLYVQRDDFLSIYVMSSAAGIHLDFKGRFLLAPFARGGQPDVPGPVNATQDPQSTNIVEMFLQPIFPGSARGIQNFTIPLTEGYLLGLVVSATGVAIKKGQVFVQAFLARGSAGGGLDLVPLVSNYVSNLFAPGWPSGPSAQSVDGSGWLHSVQQANPAAGADWTLTVPAGARWRISSLNAMLVTSATVANRNPRIHVTDGAGNIVWSSASQQLIPANTPAQVSMAPGQVTSTTDQGSINIALPGSLVLPAGFSLSTSTINLQAGDQYSNIWAEVEEWLEF